MLGLIARGRLALLRSFLLTRWHWIEAALDELTAKVDDYLSLAALFHQRGRRVTGALAFCDEQSLIRRWQHSLGRWRQESFGVDIRRNRLGLPRAHRQARGRHDVDRRADSRLALRRASGRRPGG